MEPVTRMGTPPSGDTTACRSCGTPHAPEWQTADGPVRLCPPCAALHGIGCP